MFLPIVARSSAWGAYAKVFERTGRMFSVFVLMVVIACTEAKIDKILHVDGYENMQNDFFLRALGCPVGDDCALSAHSVISISQPRSLTKVRVKSGFV
jgi:hypothetical protein